MHNSLLQHIFSSDLSFSSFKTLDTHSSFKLWSCFWLAIALSSLCFWLICMVNPPFAFAYLLSGSATVLSKLNLKEARSILD